METEQVELEPKQVVVPEKFIESNASAITLKIISAVIVFAGFIAGLELGKGQYNDIDYSVAILYWAPSIIFGALIYGGGELIRLVHEINERLKK